MKLKTAVKTFDIYIKEFTIDGVLSLVYRPMIDQMPVLGGMQMFMINPPDINIEFGGGAGLVELSSVKNAIRGVVADSIGDMMVLPNRK